MASAKARDMNSTSLFEFIGAYWDALDVERDRVPGVGIPEGRPGVGMPDCRGLAGVAITFTGLLNVRNQATRARECMLPLWVIPRLGSLGKSQHSRGVGEHVNSRKQDLIQRVEDVGVESKTSRPS